MHTWTIHFPPPLDIPASLAMFQRSGDDLLDRWDGQVLLRTCRLEALTIPFACTVSGTVDAPALTVTVLEASHILAVRQLVQHMFVTAPKALADLVATDPVIARLETCYRGVRPVLQADPLTAIIRAISAQQVNLTWAATTRRRLAQAFGHAHTLGEHEVFSLQAEVLSRVDIFALRALQFTTRKAEYIIALANALTAGTLSLDALRDASDEEVIATITRQRGLGRWTAEWFLARTLGRPRVVAGDLGVRKAIAAAYLQGRLPSEAEVRDVTAHWGDAAGVAQQLLLHALSAGGL